MLLKRLLNEKNNYEIEKKRSERQFKLESINSVSEQTSTYLYRLISIS